MTWLVTKSPLVQRSISLSYQMQPNCEICWLRWHSSCWHDLVVDWFSLIYFKNLWKFTYLLSHSIKHIGWSSVALTRFWIKEINFCLRHKVSFESRLKEPLILFSMSSVVGHCGRHDVLLLPESYLFLICFSQHHFSHHAIIF